MQKNHLFQKILLVQFVFKSKNMFLSKNQLFFHHGQRCDFFLFQTKKEGHLFPDTLVFCMNKFAYSGFASESSSAGAAASNVVATVVVAPLAAPAPEFFCIAFASRQSFQSGSELPPK